MTRLVRLIPVLALAAAFFGWEAWQAWTAPPVDAPAASGAAADNAAGSDNAAVPASADLAAAVAQIAARPLMRPDRQPYKEMAFATAAPQRNYDAEIARFSLVGLLAIDGRPTAMVVGKGGEGEHWDVSAGDSLPGYAVKEVRSDRVVLSADGKVFDLFLYGGGPKSPGGVPVRTEVQSPRPAAAVLPAPVPLPGVPVPAAIPRGVPAPAAIPGLPAPGVVPPIPGLTAPGQPVDAMGRVRTRRPPVMPSRPSNIPYGQ